MKYVTQVTKKGVVVGYMVAVSKNRPELGMIPNKYFSVKRFAGDAHAAHIAAIKYLRWWLTNCVSVWKVRAFFDGGIHKRSRRNKTGVIGISERRGKTGELCGFVSAGGRTGRKYFSERKFGSLSLAKDEAIKYRQQEFLAYVRPQDQVVR